MKNLFFIAACALLLAACGSSKSSDNNSSSNDTLQKNDPAADLIKVQNADKEFTSCIQDKGLKDAFDKYMDNDGVLLKANHKPIVSKDSVLAFLTTKKFSGIKYVRNYASFEMSESNDMAYEYGTYELNAKGPKGNEISSSGSFVSIWKKNSSDSWKITLECENEGLTPVKKQK